MAAQVSFAPDGGHLVVTERATNQISVYAIDGDDDGIEVRGPYPLAACGTTPFGFGCDRRGTLIVSEAFGGAAGASAVSSYRIGRRGGLHVVSPSVPTTETAACWIAVSGNDRFAYSTNAGSASITGYAIRHDGALERLAADGVTATTGTGPSDLAFGAEGRFLFVRNGGSNSISAYAWRRDGSLMPLAGATGLPAGANGIAAR
jgi:6-phosphogluconolactonase (cycloisomerase 2 family)